MKFVQTDIEQETRTHDFERVKIIVDQKIPYLQIFFTLFYREYCIKNVVLINFVCKTKNILFYTNKRITSTERGTLIIT